jgi:hypothetical protein
MTYPSIDQMKVERIDETNKQMFLELIQQLSTESKDKNRDWFPDILKDDGTKFDQWYVTKFENEVIAFSCVMKIEGYYRLVSRMYNCLRKKGLTDPVKQDEMSPAMLMLKQQIEDYPSDKVFISMEYLNRRKLLLKLADKLNYLFGFNFQLQDGMYKTVISEGKKPYQWQSIISQDEISLEKISISEYKTRFSNQRKTIYE